MVPNACFQALGEVSYFLGIYCTQFLYFEKQVRGIFWWLGILFRLPLVLNVLLFYLIWFFFRICDDSLNFFYVSWFNNFFLQWIEKLWIWIYFIINYFFKIIIKKSSWWVLWIFLIFSATALAFSLSFSDGLLFSRITGLLVIVWAFIPLNLLNPCHQTLLICLCVCIFLLWFSVWGLGLCVQDFLVFLASLTICLLALIRFLVSSEI